VQIFGGGLLHWHRRFGIIAIHSIYRGIKDQVLSCAFLFCPFLFWEIFLESKVKNWTSLLAAVWLILQRFFTAISRDTDGEKGIAKTY
jgi:hypothetical protein